MTLTLEGHSLETVMWPVLSSLSSGWLLHVDLDSPPGLPAFSILQALEGRMYDDRVGSQVPATGVITSLRRAEYSLKQHTPVEDNKATRTRSVCSTQINMQ